MNATKIYFIFANDKVKIGKSNNVKKRMQQIQVGCPSKVELLFSYYQLHENDEKALHARFGDLRSSGEWFYFRSHLKEFVNDLKKLPKIGEMGDYLTVDRSDEYGRSFRETSGVCVSHCDGKAVMVNFDFSSNPSELVPLSRFAQRSGE